MANVFMGSVHGAEFFGAGVDDAGGDFGGVAGLIVVSEGF